MDHRGRRGRRRSRGRRESLAPPSSSLLKNKNMFVAGAILLAFAVFQYNCRYCFARQELMKITSSIEDIAKHLQVIQSNYQLMEDKFAKYVQEIPKLEDQMAVLEALAQAIEVHRFGWNPQIHAALPFVDVNLNTLNPTQKLPIKNATKLDTSSHVIKKNSSKIM